MLLEQIGMVLLQSNDKEELRVFSIIKVINLYMICPIKRNCLTCNDICNDTCNKISKIDDGNTHGYYYNDICNDELDKRQYLQLPYPTIRNYTLEMEYKYFLDQNNRYPVSSKYAMKPDYLNHYLYQGKKQF